MEYLRIVLSALISLLMLFILTKIMGRRQIGQLSFFDYINGITIGSIASEMATNKDSFWAAFIAITIYGLASVLISVGACKSIKIRRFVTGKSVILFEKGVIYEKNLAKAKIDINEFLMECRYSGYFDLNKIHTVILETNGHMSIIPMADEKPVTTKELNLPVPEQETMIANVVMDGTIMEQNLKHTGNDVIWLERELKNYGVADVKDVFLAICDANNKLTVYEKNNMLVKRDLFT